MIRFEAKLINTQARAIKCLIASHHFMDVIDLVGALNRVGVFHIKRTISCSGLKTELERCKDVEPYTLIIMDHSILSAVDEDWFRDFRAEMASHCSAFYFLRDKKGLSLFPLSEARKAHKAKAKGVSAKLLPALAKMEQKRQGFMAENNKHHLVSA